MSRRRIIPGFGLSLGYTLTYLSVIILIPLVALFMKASQMGWADSVKLLKSPGIVAAAKLSFGASAIAALCSSVLGLLIAWVLVRYRFPGRKFFDAMVDLPFALPTAVAGITLSQIYSTKGWVGKYLAQGAQWVKEHHAPGGWIGGWVDTISQRGAAYSSIGVFIALFFIGLPFVVRTVQPVMEDLSKDTEEAAATLGAGRWTVFWRVIFPSILPALITGFTLAFARAVGEYGSVIFISGNLPLKTEILPSLIISQLEQFKYESAAVIAAAMLVVSFVLLFLINLLQRRLNWRTR
ncbi:sulfate ABC transporter permease subunit CysT [Luteolibacter ambystomatis]|uniref:Sulfate ABC transporter permease subunit CysT n=1 Tax=Luteolibacter ambystomatis TaxID=2824561 RepID=A0A975J2L1_9BACT|nr:sulfate ABC transporter permease subunit CysT [Luteolibacter ambystomatis]QUE52861.1 sulfate ABC transporter permease subunit CysT [Luteolibacter ambystomatis]